jgi:hypothetical protein
MNTKWTPLYENFIRQNYMKMSDEELTAALHSGFGCDFSIKSVKLKRQRLRLEKDRGGKREGAGRPVGS